MQLTVTNVSLGTIPGSLPCHSSQIRGHKKVIHLLSRPQVSVGYGYATSSGRDSQWPVLLRQLINVSRVYHEFQNNEGIQFNNYAE